MKCSFCDRDAIHYKKYEGNWYCKIHFLESVEKKVKQTIRKFKLIGKKEKIGVALSGGKDSTSLLYILKKIYEKNPRIKIVAISIDEGVGQHRKNSLKKAKELTKMLNVEHHIFSFKKEFGFSINEIAKKVLEKGFSVCSVCGVLRRWLLNKKARELKITKLATAFNLDDECQSIIMNVLKGDLLRLARINPLPQIIKDEKFVPRIKPLMFVPEEETKLYAKIRNLPFDESICKYKKYNTLRFETQKFLNLLEEKSPGIKNSLVNSGLKLAELLRKKIKTEKIKYCRICGEPTSKNVCRACELRRFFGFL